MMVGWRVRVSDAVGHLISGFVLSGVELGLKIVGFEGVRGPGVQRPVVARRPTSMRKSAASGQAEANGFGCGQPFRQRGRRS